MISAEERSASQADAPQDLLEGIEPEAIARMTKMILCDGYTFGDALNTSEKQLHALYNWGYELQKRGRFSQAMSVFQYLCFLNHYDEHAWIALGFCREQLRHYRPAVQAYVMAGMLAPDNPIPALRSAECLLQIGELDGAEIAAQKALELAGDDPRLEQRRVRAEFLLKVVRKKQTKRNRAR